MDQWLPPIAASAVAAALLSDAVPDPEASAGTAGSAMQAPRWDHRHPRLTSAHSGLVLNASGECAVTFTRTFSQMPAVVCLYVEAADNQPVLFKVKSWAQDGSNNYTGCVVKGYRAQSIPTNLATLLLGGVFNLFNASASGVNFGAIALQVS